MAKKPTLAQQTSSKLTIVRKKNHTQGLLNISFFGCQRKNKHEILLAKIDVMHCFQRDLPFQL
jgi:hypothetical protein